jgi:futalosine hydrolase
MEVSSINGNCYLYQKVTLLCPFTIVVAMNLILVPTSYEAQNIFETTPAPSAPIVSLTSKTMLAICGFGLSASGAGAAYAIHSYFQKNGHFPEQVILAGIAGSYDTERLPIGGVIVPTDCACYGIGKGSASEFISAEEMGWKQGVAIAEQDPVGDRLSISGSPHAHRLAVSVTAASKEQTDIDRIKTRYPEALSEDMETFSVALACRLFGIKLMVVRAASNAVGDPFENWNTSKAFKSLRTYFSTALVTQDS